MPSKRKERQHDIEEKDGNAQRKGNIDYRGLSYVVVLQRNLYLQTREMHAQLRICGLRASSYKEIAESLMERICKEETFCSR